MVLSLLLFLAYGCPIALAPFVEWAVLPTLNCFCTFVQKNNQLFSSESILTTQVAVRFVHHGNVQLGTWISDYHQLFTLVSSFALTTVLYFLPRSLTHAACGRILMTWLIVCESKRLADILLIMVIIFLVLLLLHEIPPLCACLRST